MDRQQAQNLIQATFEQAFDRMRYHTFLNEVFNGQIDTTQPLVYAGDALPGTFRNHVRQVERIGIYHDPDGHEIDLLVVYLARASTLDRARTMQRNLAAKHLRDEYKETALIAYVHDGHANWRFSMVRREPVVSFGEAGIKVRDDITPVRRFSFLVGAHESTHTAQQQLYPLLSDSLHDPTLESLEQAFNIETVTQEFFEGYNNFFLTLTDELNRLQEQSSGLATEFKTNGITSADFVKKLLGQLVFLYFVQKKGWLGVATGEPWGSGSKNFLREQFERQGYINFFNDVLEPLFYEALAIERPDHVYAPLGVRIPFLNGGLFEPLHGYDWRSVDILLPNHLFESIFAAFDRYNFTVREDEPLEKEVAVDPEMLGKVFERLLEVKDRKSKGAFYTPREIVHFMCQESLIEYLSTRFNGAIPREDFALFVRVGEIAVHNTLMHESQGRQDSTEDAALVFAYTMPATIRDSAQAIDAALADITVCDPAIGSGAFPVGMMQEIVKAREVLSTYLPSDGQRTSYTFKRHAIQASIYGVDLDQGAIDIAKLRLWLSLVVDEDDYRQIKPLPNLDYKIVCGNSLLSYPYKRQGLEELERLKRHFFDETDPQQKYMLRKQIEEILHQIFANTVKSLGYQVTMDFQINFSEVFRENGGFDVVIGNPPYVRQERIKEYKTTFQTLYPDVYVGTADLFVYFYAQGIALLRSGGVLTMITPNKFIRANYGEKLRQFLATKTTLHTLIDFGDLPVFDATTYPMIVIGQKQRPHDHDIKVLEITSKDDVHLLHQKLEDMYPIPQKALSSEGWQLTSPEIRAIMDKIKRIGKPLGEYIDGKMWYGVKTGFNEAFIIDKDQREALISADPRSAEVIKPYLRGRDIKRWQVHWEDLYLIFTRRGIDIDSYPVIKAHLLQYRERLTPGIPGGRKAGSYEWYEIQDNIAYYTEFDKPKIIYQEIATFQSFAFTDKPFYTNNKCFILPDASLYLLAILNSHVVWFFLGLTVSKLQGNAYALQSIYMQHVPIPVVSESLEHQISEVARACLDAPPEKPTYLYELEQQLNHLVYQAYDLDPYDIQLIERNVQISDVQRATSFIQRIKMLTQQDGNDA